MSTNQEVMIAALQDNLGAGYENYTFEGLWHTYWDNQGIAAGTFNERMLTWINDQLNASYTSLPEAMQAYAEDAGYDNWISMAAVTLNVTEGQIVEALFGASEDGALYNPSDTTSLYQSRTGGDVVASDGDDVGIMLDKSQMGGLAAADFIAAQPELQTNGTFATDSDWTKGTGWTISGGTANFDGLTAFSQFTQVGIVPVGKFYHIQFDLTAAGSNVSSVRVVMGGTFIGSIAVSGVGTYTGVMKNTSAGANFAFQSNSGTSGADDAFSIDNVVIKEIPGNHAVATSDAARPLYKTSGGLHWLLFDGVDDVIGTGLFGFSQPLTHVVAVEDLSNTDNVHYINGNSTSNAAIYYASGSLRIYAGTNVIDGVYPVNTPGVIRAYFNTTSSSIFVNGEQRSTGSAGANNPDGISIGAFKTSAFSNIRYYGGIHVDRDLTADERSDADAFIAAKGNIGAPVLDGVPTVSGVEAVYNTLTATPASLASGSAYGTMTYQWYRSGTEISGATSTTYTLTSDDIGETITVTQTATNGFGTGTGTSTATSAINSDAYIVDGVSPATVADFAGTLNGGTEYYRVNGSDSTFASMLTHSRTSNATMFDSDGTLKWAPHNILLQSNSFSTTWSKTATSLTSGQADYESGTNAWLLQGDGVTAADVFLSQGPTLVSNAQYDFEVVVKAEDNTWCALLSTGYAGTLTTYFNLSTGTKGATDTFNGAITDLGSGWYKVRGRLSATTATSGSFRIYPAVTNGTVAKGNDASSGIYIMYARVFKSSLGGMVDNPNRSDSYVPTTTAAVYSPRRNNYRYNGSTWVNKGILIEPTAATNLVWNNNTTTGIAALQGATANATVTQNAIGTAMVSFTDNGNNNIHGCYPVSFNTATNTNYTVSAFVLAGVRDYVCLSIGVDANNYASVVFDLTDGTVGETSVGGTSGTLNHYGIEDFGGGLYRVYINGQATGVGNMVIGAATAATGNTFGNYGQPVYTGTSQITHYVGYLQAVQTSDMVSSVIPTLGTNVTRLAETLTIANANMAKSTTAMSFHVKGEIDYADEGVSPQEQFLDWTKDANNLMNWSLRTNGALTGTIQVQQYINPNVISKITTDVYTPGIGVNFNLASRHTQTELQVAVDGTAQSAATGSASLPDFTSGAMKIGTSINSPINYALFRQDDSDWGDAGIEEATT